MIKDSGIEQKIDKLFVIKGSGIDANYTTNTHSISLLLTSKINEVITKFKIPTSI